MMPYEKSLTKSPIILQYIALHFFNLINVLTLLVMWQKQHSVCKKPHHLSLQVLFENWEEENQGKLDNPGSCGNGH